MEKGNSGEKYILGGENISYKEFFQIIHWVTGIKGKLIKAPISIGRLYSYWHVVQSKLQGKEPFFSSKGVNNIFCNKSFSSEKSVQQLGYTITPFALALQQTVDFLKYQTNV